MSDPKNAAKSAEDSPPHDSHEDHHAPGTMVLVMALLGSFVVYYFANWIALADVWHVR